VEQDVPLPRNQKFEKKEPSYRQLVEEHQYGLYTDMAKKAHEEAKKNSGNTLSSFRQW
jgi:hypothetical protein